MSRGLRRSVAASSRGVGEIAVREFLIRVDMAERLTNRHRFGFADSNSSIGLHLLGELRHRIHIRAH